MQLKEFLSFAQENHLSENFGQALEIIIPVEVDPYTVDEATEIIKKIFGWGEKNKISNLHISIDRGEEDYNLTLYDALTKYIIGPAALPFKFTLEVSSLRKEEWDNLNEVIANTKVITHLILNNVNYFDGTDKNYFSGLRDNVGITELDINDLSLNQFNLLNQLRRYLVSSDNTDLSMLRFNGQPLKLREGDILIWFLLRNRAYIAIYNDILSSKITVLDFNTIVNSLMDNKNQRYPLNGPWRRKFFSAFNTNGSLEKFYYCDRGSYEYNWNFKNLLKLKSTLKTLVFNNLSDYVKDIESVLLDFLIQNTQLTEFKMGQSDVINRSHLLTALLQTLNLENLDFYYEDSDHELKDVLFKLMREHPKLKSLKLTNFSLPENELSEWLQIATQHPMLAELELKNINFNDTLFAKFLEMLIANKNLTALDLRSCQFSIFNFNKLLETLRVHPNLKKLILDTDAYNMGALRTFINENDNLKELAIEFISGNNLDEVNIGNLLNITNNDHLVMFKFQHKSIIKTQDLPCLLSCLNKFSVLEQLDLGSIEITHESIKLLTNYVAAHPLLTQLTYTPAGNSLVMTEEDNLKNSLQHNAYLLAFYHRMADKLTGLENFLIHNSLDLMEPSQLDTFYMKIYQLQPELERCFDINWTPAKELFYQYIFLLAKIQINLGQAKLAYDNLEFIPHNSKYYQMARFEMFSMQINNPTLATDDEYFKNLVASGMTFEFFARAYIERHQHSTMGLLQLTPEYLAVALGYYSLLVHTNANEIFVQNIPENSLTEPRPIGSGNMNFADIPVTAPYRSRLC